MVACLFVGLVGGQPAVRAESIKSSDFKIDIASNMAWIENKDPAVGQKLWRQTAMEQVVLASRPYVRVTNNAAVGQIESFQLSLAARPATAVTACLWEPSQEKSRWTWNPEQETALFKFAKPVESGDSFTIRLATGPRAGGQESYSLLQNFFAPGQPIFAQTRASGMSGFGVLGVTAFDPTRISRSSQTASGAGDVEVIEHFTYSLASVVIDPYKTYGQQVGITVAAVPEPSTVGLLSGAMAVGVAAATFRRRRTAA